MEFLLSDAYGFENDEKVSNIGYLAPISIKNTSCNQLLYHNMGNLIRSPIKAVEG